MLVIAIPLLTLGYLWESLAESRISEARALFSHRLQEQAERLAVAMDPELFLQRPLTAVMKRFLRHPQVSLSRLMSVLSVMANGRRFELFALHRDGLRIESSAGAENLWLMRRLMSSLMESASSATQNRETNRLLSNAFALGIGLEKFQRGRGRLISVPFQGSDAYLTW